MNKADEYLLEIGLDSDLLPEFFNNDDKSYYSVPELMDSFAQERIKQEREKWEKELEDKTKALKNLVTEVYKTKQHHSNIDLKESLERAESSTTK